MLARAWANNDGLSKVRNSLWIRKGPQKLIYVGCRRDSQSRKQKTVEHAILLNARGNFRSFGKHTIWKFSGLPIRGVFRFPETFENNTFARPRARPERVRFGPLTRRLFRRPLQRTVRFELFGTLAAESPSLFLTKTTWGFTKPQK